MWRFWRKPQAAYPEPVAEAAPPKSSIRDRIRAMVGRSAVLEIGPAYYPIVSKAAGYDVKILDHADQRALRKKYKDYPVPLDNIEDVDFIGTSPDVVTGVFDHIVCSHLMEHTPDLIAFLKQCSRLMHEGSRLHAIVPDKRTCFDLLRPVTTTGQVIDAHVLGRRRHVGVHFDLMTHAVTRSGKGPWQPGDPDLPTPLHTFEETKTTLKRLMKSDHYLDSHAWVFTPTSMKLVMTELHGAGLTDLAVEECLSDPTEIYVSLRKGRAEAFDEDAWRTLFWLNCRERFNEGDPESGS